MAPIIIIVSILNLGVCWTDGTTLKSEGGGEGAHLSPLYACSLGCAQCCVVRCVLFGYESTDST